MKKLLLIALAMFAPAIAHAQSSTASRLGVYTTDNVPALTLGYTDQFGNASGASLTMKGATSGSVVVTPDPVASGNFYTSNPALSSTATSLSLTSTVTPLPIPGFSKTLAPSALYVFRAHIHGSSSGAGGLKLTSTGTAVPSVYNVTTSIYNGSTIGALTNTTTVGTAALASTTTFTDAYMDGTVSTGSTGGGTFIIQAGQNVSDATATAITTTGSQMQIWRVQ